MPEILSVLKNNLVTILLRYKESGCVLDRKNLYNIATSIENMSMIVANSMESMGI